MSMCFMWEMGDAKREASANGMEEEEDEEGKEVD